MEAYILVHSTVGRALAIAEEAARTPGVTSAEAVTGPYDVIVSAGAEDLGHLVREVVADIQSIRGVTRTLTCPLARHGHLWEEAMEPAYAHG
jgi:DNA-binding Lrp family transcriptional regulator